MSKAIIADRAELEAIAAKVDAELGYPRAGVNVGDGIHVPPEMGVTLRHAEIQKHPDREEYAYPVDAVAESKLEAKDVAAAEALPKDWETKLPTDAGDAEPAKEVRRG